MVASVIHSRYVGLDMTRKLSVPSRAPLEQQMWCDAEEPAAAATNSHHAQELTSSAKGNHSQVSSLVHAVQETEAGPQSTAQSVPQHAREPYSVGDRSGRGGQPLRQEDSSCGQTEHHVSFRLAPEQLGTPVRRRSTPAHKSPGPANMFQQFTFGESGKRAANLCLKPHHTEMFLAHDPKDDHDMMHSLHQAASWSINCYIPATLDVQYA